METIHLIYSCNPVMLLLGLLWHLVSTIQASYGGADTNPCLDQALIFVLAPGACRSEVLKVSKISHTTMINITEIAFHNMQESSHGDIADGALGLVFPDSLRPEYKNEYVKVLFVYK